MPRFQIEQLRMAVCFAIIFVAENYFCTEKAIVFYTFCKRGDNYLKMAGFDCAKA